MISYLIIDRNRCFIYLDKKFRLSVCIQSSDLLQYYTTIHDSIQTYGTITFNQITVTNVITKNQDI